MHSITYITTLALLSTTGWAHYVLEDDYMKDGNFFDLFSFFTDADPTHGFVDYIDQGSAANGGLISSSSSQVYMGVEHANVASSAGRQSVRITSNKAYDAGLIILDLEHMPGGICGTWPAFWTVGPNWPTNGEIDIIEGVNDQTANDMTLHTGPGCSITDNGGFTGQTTTPNCDINAAGQGTNAGCQIVTSNTQTYGSGFNANKGGVYATEWTSSAISIFFFPRGSIPSDISSGSPNPSGWGKPLAKFQGGCDISSKFKQQQIVFDTTFCGDWAGNTWSTSSCASQADTCSAFVQNNPDAFAEAYWTVNSLKVYQAGAGGSGSAAPSRTDAPGSTDPTTTSSPTTSAESPAPTLTSAPASPAPTTFVSYTRSGLSSHSRSRTFGQGRNAIAGNTTDANGAADLGTATGTAVDGASTFSPDTTTPLVPNTTPTDFQSVAGPTGRPNPASGPATPARPTGSGRFPGHGGHHGVNERSMEEMIHARHPRVHRKNVDRRR